jgi:hypothetical protein
LIIAAPHIFARIFMSHTFSGDGTGECCQRIKSGLQERLLCTVWFDKAEIVRRRDEARHGQRQRVCDVPDAAVPDAAQLPAGAHVGMDMCAADKTKKLCVLPLHPSVSFAS